MNRLIVTDLNKIASGRVFIVNPQDVEGKNFNYRQVFNKTIKLEALVHTGMLEYERNFGFGENPLYDFKPCGGQVLKVSMDQTPVWYHNPLWNREKDTIVIRCFSCGMLFRINYQDFIIESMMSRLILKQMVPILKNFNYFNCVAKGFKDFYIDKDDKKIASLINGLGLIALIPCGLFGYQHQPEKSLSRVIGPCDFGFTIFPGIKTFESFDGWDDWARFLIQKKDGELKKFLDNVAYPLLLGPKSLI